MGGHKCEARNGDFCGAPEAVAGDVPCCTHTAGKRCGSQRYRANTQLAANMSESAIVGLETTSNSARGVFGPFPVDYVTESLFCHNGKHFCVQNHVFTTMAAILRFCFWRILFYLPPTFLRNPVILVQFPHPRVPGCSWSPCFRPGGKRHKLHPPFLVGFPVLHLA